MARKYHWSYERAMQLVDTWAKRFRLNLSADKYETLVQSIANELESERRSSEPVGRPSWPIRRQFPYDAHVELGG